MKQWILLLVLLACPCFCHPKMSIEEKVGQLLMVHFNGTEANEDAKTLIQEVGVGGIIYYNWANGLHSPEQVRRLSASLQELSRIPLLIAADQEGGVVCRLNKGVPVFPGNRALSATEDVNLSEQSAFAMGQYLRMVGVNLNLAPVVDVNNNPRNPIIGIRSYGDSPEIVISFAQRALCGFHHAGVATSLKHFPGHGDVEIDSHEALPYVNRTREELDKTELLPFTRLAKETDTIMTAHIMVPSIDPLHCATLSQKTLEILRKEIGFEGVIISDSLLMAGVLQGYPLVEEAVIAAFNAGCDILLLGGKSLVDSVKKECTVLDVQQIHKALVSAVKTGRISEERLDESVQRILKLKEKYTALGVPTQFDEEKHYNLAKLISSRALKVFSNRTLPKGKAAIFAPWIIRDSLLQSSFKGVRFFDKEPAEKLKMAVDEADFLICFSYNSWKNVEQYKILEKLTHQKPFVMVVLRDPLDAELFPAANLMMITHGPTPASLEAAYEAISDHVQSQRTEDLAKGLVQ